MLNLYNKSVLLLKELKNKHIYITIKEKYVLNKKGNKKDRVILYIT
jgi:hypothetical protein